VNFDSM